MYTTQLLLDEKSSTYVRSIWKSLSEHKIDSTMNNVNDLHPHITLAVYEDINVEKFIEKLNKFKHEIKPMATTFDILGSFPSTNICFISPTITHEILELHNKYYDYFSEFNDTARGYYLPNRWVPHCSLIMAASKEKAKEAFDFTYDIYEPFEAILNSIALYKVELTQGNVINSTRLF
ncbi:MAG: 2'-5' RNA ligase family protein [Fusobacteriaceae bacterium]